MRQEYQHGGKGGSEGLGHHSRSQLRGDKTLAGFNPSLQPAIPEQRTWLDDSSRTPRSTAVLGMVSWASVLMPVSSVPPGPGWVLAL